MKRTTSVLLMIVIYALLFVASFGLISYFSDFALLADIKYQLYIGIASLLLVIIMLILMASASSKKEKSEEDELEDEEENEENQEDEQELEEEQEVISEATSEEENDDQEALDTDEYQDVTMIDTLSINEDNELSHEQEDGNDSYQNSSFFYNGKEIIPSGKKIEFVDPSDLIDNEPIDLHINDEVISEPLVNQQEINSVEENTNEAPKEENAQETSEVNLESKVVSAVNEEELVNEENDEASVIEENLDEALSKQQEQEFSENNEEILTFSQEVSVVEENIEDAIENQKTVKLSLPEKETIKKAIDEFEGEQAELQAKPDLTETQIVYINNSQNSYLNEHGVPQLVMTNEMNADRFEKRSVKEIVEDNKTIEDLENEMALEREYLKEEKQEKIISFLITIIILGVLALVGVTGYYFYRRYLG